VPTQRPIEPLDGGLVLPVAEVMDYLHFVVSIDIGDENSSVTINPILDTASGKMMIWNHEQLTSNDLSCGCFWNNRDSLGLCSESTAEQDQCWYIDYCAWSYDYDMCTPWYVEGYIPFQCDNELIYWVVNVSGTASMRFSGDTGGTFNESNLLLVDFKYAEQSDIPIHNFSDMRTYTDGIIGLSYNYSSHSSTFWDLYSNGVPEVFALDFNRNCGVENPCELHINYTNTDRYDVQYGDPDFAHVLDFDGKIIFHEFEMYDLLLCNTRLLGDLPNEMVNVLVDTGSSCLTLNTKAFSIMRQMLSPLLTCLQVQEGRPRTCFVATKNLDNLPPFRFRMKSNSSVWLNLRLDKLVFGDLSGSSRLEFPDGEYYELCIQEIFYGSVFGTMVLTNFYSVFDLVTHQVGLANHNESNEYIDVVSGETIVCNYGMEGQPDTLTACETDKIFCPTSAPVKEDGIPTPSPVTRSGSPTTGPGRGLIIPLMQALDYLHFVVSIEVGEGDDAIVVNSIVDTAFGALMLWNYEGVTSSTMTCGCYTGSPSFCTFQAGDEETCEKYDFCDWISMFCDHGSEYSSEFLCDNEEITWDMEVSGRTVMRFYGDSDGDPLASNVVLASFQEPEQSNTPIHNFTQMIEHTDGILGLSYDYINVGQKTTFWDIYGSKPEYFALDFKRNCGVDNPCEMHIDYISDEYDLQFGDADYEREYLFDSNVIFHEFEMYDLLLCNTRLFDVLSVPDENVLIDTGSSCLVLQTELFEALTTLLAPIVMCRASIEGRPKTCFIRKENLANLPPLRFRMHSDSDTWLVIRLENLRFGEGAILTTISDEDYELCIQEHSSNTVFGTMAMTNFYAVFDLVNQRVGLSNHNESNQYLDFDTGEMITCNYGELGEPETLSYCDSEEVSCGQNNSSSSSHTDVFVVLVILVAVLVLALVLFFCVMRSRQLRTEVIEAEGFWPSGFQGVTGRLGDKACVQVNDDGIGEVDFRNLVEQGLWSEPTDQPTYPPHPADEVEEDDVHERTVAVPNPQDAQETRL